jgi:Zn-dependent protease
MPLGENLLADRLMVLIPLWLSLSVHEWAHAWAAWRLGDDTAARLGRMTINPLAHIDPVGTLLLPLMGVPFGWAKPVPIQPHRFYRGVNMRTGMMIVAVAGPIANLCLAAIGIVIFALLVHFRPMLLAQGQPMGALVQTMIFLNVLLAAFNALPVPPLDGSRVVDALVPNALRPAWDGFCQLGPLALGAVILVPILLGVSLFQWPMEATQSLLWQIELWLGG